MLNLVKPQGLKSGDKVATGDTDLLWRYDLGKERLKVQFGLEIMAVKGYYKKQKQ